MQVIIEIEADNDDDDNHLLQELMFTLEGFDNTAWFLTCYQFFIYGILAFVHLGIAGLEQRRFE